MNLSDTTQSLLSLAIRGAAERQTALSANLANANTPGYRRVDVDFHSVLQRAAATGAENTTAIRFTPEVDGAAVMQLDGNTVDVDVEASRMAANGLEYETLMAVKRGRSDIIQIALGTR